MGDPVKNDFPRRRLRPLNGVLLRIPIQQHIQFRHFGNPTAIDFSIQLNGELHSHRIPSWLSHPLRVANPATIAIDNISTMHIIEV